jgi:hypothetical protein
MPPCYSSRNQLLRKKGYRAQHLDEGVIDWRARGWRVEKSPKEDRS